MTLSFFAPTTWIKSVRISYVLYLINISLTFLLVNRWFISGHFPLSNLYESLIFLSWSFSTIYSITSFSLRGFTKATLLPTISWSVTPITLLTCGYAFLCVPQELQKAESLVPALQSNWLIMHVSVMILSYASLILGSLFAFSLLLIIHFPKMLNPLYRFSNQLLVYFVSFVSLVNLYLLKSFSKPTKPSEKLTLFYLKKANKKLGKQKDFLRFSLATPTPNFLEFLSLSKKPLAKSPAVSPAVSFHKATTLSHRNLAKLIGKQIPRQNTNNGFVIPLEQGSWGYELCSFYAIPTPLVPRTGYKLLADKAAFSFTSSNKQNLFSKYFDGMSGFYLAIPLDKIYLGYLKKKKQIKQTQTIVKNNNFLDNLSYRFIGLGFVLLTLGIISGAVWANSAWGSYWSWDPKETWAFITWLTYAIYLHLRISKGWYGKQSAFVAFFGFFVVWFCYLGVNLFGKGLHTYAFV